MPKYLKLIVAFCIMQHFFSETFSQEAISIESFEKEFDEANFKCGFVNTENSQFPHSVAGGDPTHEFQKLFVQTTRKHFRLDPADYILERTSEQTYVQVYSAGNVRYVQYNPEKMTDFDTKCGSKWASVSVIFHEMSHFDLQHDTRRNKDKYKTENEKRADDQAGFKMRKLKYEKPEVTLEDALAAILTVADEKPRNGYPSREDRVKQIKQGWQAAEDEHLSPLAFIEKNALGKNSLPSAIVRSAEIALVNDPVKVDYTLGGYAHLVTKGILEKSEKISNRYLKAFDSDLTVEIVRNLDSTFFSQSLTILPDEAKLNTTPANKTLSLPMKAIFVASDSTLLYQDIEIVQGNGENGIQYSIIENLDMSPYKGFENVLKTVPLNSTNTAADLSNLRRLNTSKIITKKGIPYYISLNKGFSNSIYFNEDGELIYENNRKSIKIGTLSVSNKKEYSYMIYDRYYRFWYIDPSGYIYSEKNEKLGEIPPAVMLNLYKL
ncbi:MAG: hypothetical protein BGO21_26330 [Dyadobacter sp. 50-39]|uniref:hypothetical protein n=1 Tax=Dyadobacter sp. 50-39 TaxID=1895756 RepID=UPI00095BE8F8|nr:hypothetical protein [Dyadobacter sp. 50-39]OJV16417.1 MAG: hypothetical protein BGO21_26330 [Dyadobacter sp. 50-39]